MIAAHGQVGYLKIRTADARMVGSLARILQLISILLTVVTEVREQAVQIEIGIFCELVIQTAGKSVSRPVVEVLLNIQLVERGVAAIVEVRNGLYVIDAPS